MDEEGLINVSDAKVFVTGPVNTLKIGLQSNADLHVIDPNGRHVGINEQTRKLETRIPESSFQVLDPNGQPISPCLSCMSGEGNSQVVTFPLYQGGRYIIRLVGTSDGPFALTLEGQQDGIVIASQSYSGDILKGEVLTINLMAMYTKDGLSVQGEPLTYSPVLRVGSESH